MDASLVKLRNELFEQSLQKQDAQLILEILMANKVVRQPLNVIIHRFKTEFDKEGRFQNLSHQRVDWCWILNNLPAFYQS